MDDSDGTSSDASATDRPCPDGGADRFRFEYRPGAINYGRGCVEDLATELARQDLERALVICGRTVGNTPAVIDPVEAGLGERHAGTFAETTPEKRLETAFDALEAMRSVDADVVVGLGGGSSLDLATVTSVLSGADRPPEAVGEEFGETGTISIPDGDLAPIVTVPTTLAGADLSMLAGVTADPSSGLVDEPVSGGVGDPRLMPLAGFYDPALFETTPTDVLAASAMNGFDKGVESLYAPAATPITDATASRGLRLLREALPSLRDDDRDADVLERIVRGIVLVQYGVSRPDATTLSLIHAFGHGVTARADVHQGRVHAAVAPAVLRYLFAEADGRRALLADALGGSATDRSADALASAVVDAVVAVRDGLGLPDRLRSLEGVQRSDLRAMAEATREDSLADNVPPGLDPTVEDLEGVLEDAW